MTMESLPSNMYIIVGGGDDMGDLEYIEGKVLAGDYFQVSGDINALNDTIEFIVPNGRTAFLIEAKIIISTHTSPPSMPVNSTNTTSDRVRAVLKIDTVIKDTTNIGIVATMSSNGLAGGEPSGGASNGQIGDGKFNVLGLSLIGDAAKTIEIENTLDGGSAFATMSGYLV